LVLVIGLFTTSPNGIVLAHVVASVFALVFIARQPVRRGVFNMAQATLTTVIAILLFEVIAQTPDPVSPRAWLAALVGVVSVMLVSFVIVAFAITIPRGRPRDPDFFLNAIVGSVAAVVNTMLGLVVVIECAQSPAAAVLLIAPVVTVFVAYRAYLSE